MRNFAFGDLVHSQRVVTSLTSCWQAIIGAAFGKNRNFACQRHHHAADWPCCWARWIFQALYQNWRQAFRQHRCRWVKLRAHRQQYVNH